MNQTIEIALDEQVELCRNGDKQAYFEVYRQFAKPMLNSSMRIVNNMADAEDMVQEAFTDAFKNLERFTYKSPFEAWLKRIVINKSLDLLRRRKMNFVNIDHVQVENSAFVEMDEETFTYKINRIKKAITTLPDVQRIIFNLYAVDEIPQEEIANMLGLSHNNVRTLYHRAKKKILEFLKHEENEN